MNVLYNIFIVVITYLGEFHMVSHSKTNSSEGSACSDFFTTSPLLSQITNSTGNFLTFYGSAIIFSLHDSVAAQLESLQGEIYLAIPEMLSEPLDPVTFHVPIYELFAGKPSDRDWEVLNSKFVEIRQLLLSMQNQPTITLNATHIFNYENTYLALGLSPIDTEGTNQLSFLQRSIENLLPSGKPFPFHIPLAYYRPGSYPTKAITDLCHTLQPKSLSFTLHMKDLLLDVFTSVNSFSTLSKKNYSIITSGAPTQGKSSLINIQL